MTTMIERREIMEAYSVWRTAMEGYSWGETAAMWKVITGLWYLQADVIEMPDESADLIRSMKGDHGMTICKALMAKHGLN